MATISNSRPMAQGQLFQSLCADDWETLSSYVTETVPNVNYLINVYS